MGKNEVLEELHKIREDQTIVSSEVIPNKK
jgi:hypothetical protein